MKPWCGALLVAVSCAVAAPSVVVTHFPAQSPPSAPKLDVGFGVTPPEAIEQMFKMARVKPTDVVCDLGCGDGRIVVTASKQYGVKSVGIDIDPVRVKESLENARTNGVAGLVKIVEGDLFEYDFTEATVVTLFLTEPLNIRLMPKLKQLKPGTRILSFDFPMGDAKPAEIQRGTFLEGGAEYTIYLWVVPWEVSAKPGLQ